MVGWSFDFHTYLLNGFKKKAKSGGIRVYWYESHLRLTLVYRCTKVLILNGIEITGWCEIEE